jgi:hypothetical protein
MSDGDKCDAEEMLDARLAMAAARLMKRPSMCGRLSWKAQPAVFGPHRSSSVLTVT